MATKTELIEQVMATPWVQTNCPSVVNNYGTSVPVSQIYRETSGVSTPNFRRRLNRGELLPFTPFEQYSYEFSAPAAENEYKVWNSTTCYEWFQNWIPSMTYSGWLSRESMRLIVEEHRNLAEIELQQAAGRLYADGWDALTFLAEWNKTVQGFRSVGNRLRDFLTHQGPILTKLRIDKPGEIAKTAAQSLLEARYQWRTLYYDAMDLSRTLARLDRTGLRSKKRATSEHTITEVKGVSMNSTGRWTSTWETTTNTTISYRGSVIADLRAPDFGFNPLTTAWEIMPWSFVVDWFVNVGQSLEAISFIILSRGRYESAIGLNVRQEYVSTVKNLAFTSPWRQTTFKRSASGVTEMTWRVPTTVPYLPQVSVNLDAFKVADLVALIGLRYRSLLSRLPRDLQTAWRSRGISTS